LGLQVPGGLYDDCRSGFGGYVWNKKLFPNPLPFQEWVHSVGLELTLNIHDQVCMRTRARTHTHAHTHTHTHMHTHTCTHTHTHAHTHTHIHPSVDESALVTLLLYKFCDAFCRLLMIYS
jgi:hypothetical protein